jgi:hypothetical protein
MHMSNTMLYRLSKKLFIATFVGSSDTSYCSYSCSWTCLLPQWAVCLLLILWHWLGLCLNNIPLLRGHLLLHKRHMYVGLLVHYWLYTGLVRAIRHRSGFPAAIMARGC